MRLDQIRIEQKKNRIEYNRQIDQIKLDQNRIESIDQIDQIDRRTDKWKEDKENGDRSTYRGLIRTVEQCRQIVDRWADRKNTRQIDMYRQVVRKIDQEKDKQIRKSPLGFRLYKFI